MVITSIFLFSWFIKMTNNLVVGNNAYYLYYIAISISLKRYCQMKKWLKVKGAEK